MSMNFEIEVSDEQFRLQNIGPQGVLATDAVPYFSVSTTTGSDGVVYGAYLTGAEPELDRLLSDDNAETLVSHSIKIYDLTAWPNLKAIDATVTLVDTLFDNEEEDDEEEEGEPGAPLELA